MFGKEKDAADQAGSGTADSAAESSKSEAQSSAAPSIISADMKVVGDLQSGGDIQIEGSVEGDVKSRTVTIGEKANINGSVNADTSNILGRINGEINASVVRIAKSANVQGDIYYQTLSIEDGAVIDGKVKRKDSAGTKSETTPKPAASEPSSDVNVASMKPSVTGGDSKPSDASPGLKPQGSKPLGR